MSGNKKLLHDRLTGEILRVAFNISNELGSGFLEKVYENAVLVEIKATEKHNPVYVAQTLNYLKATGLYVGLLLNFGRPRLSHKRLISRKLLDKSSNNVEAPE